QHRMMLRILASFSHIQGVNLRKSFCHETAIVQAYFSLKQTIIGPSAQSAGRIGWRYILFLD
ncbi:MAG: hypothetical protein ACXIVE_03455, partial [Salinarimonas sp.]